MADQTPETRSPAKPKKPNAYDEPFGNEKTYEHVTRIPERPAESTPAEPAVHREEPTEAPKVKPRKTSSTQKKKTTPKESPARKTGSERTSSTATPFKKTETVTNKREKPARDPNLPRSARVIHQIMPYVLIGLSIFIGVALILNLFCNPTNILGRENDQGLTPDDHWMGIVGYGLCYGLFGMFGPAAFAIPLALFNMGLFWKRYIDHKLAISKIVASVLFVLMLASVIHIFCLMALEPTQRNISAKILITTGAETTGGGLAGGKLGYLLYSFCHFTGALIIGFLLLAASLFYFIGMTPQHLWSYLRNRRKLRSGRTPSYSEQGAEDAENRAKMEEKIRRMTGSHIDDPIDGEEGAPVGAVRVTKTTASRKNPADRIAPMPMPRLDPNDGEDVYVPDAVNDKMAAMEEEESIANELAIRQGARADAERAARNSAPTPAQAPASASIDPASNRDAAVEPIFPKTAENRQGRRIPRSDRNFDLKSIFVDPEESDTLMQRQHAPVPPEVPLTPLRRPTSTQAQTRPASAAAAAQAPSGAARPISVANTIRTPGAQPANRPAAKAPTAAAPTTAPAPAKKPLPKVPTANTTEFQPVQPEKQDFGLSNEEFERLEAGRVELPRPGAKKTASPAAKAPVDAKAPSKEAGKESGKTSAAKPAPKAAPKRYIFPPISYLHQAEPMTEENRAELEASMNALATTLKSFHVGIEDNIRYACGPTVTRYEITPAAGVRVRSITNLSDDIALALRASGGVRIEAPIPGTNAVGIEVPNKSRSTIYLRELIESKPFSESKSKLTACLGAGIAGEPLVFDIAKMPHLLIAGTTGSGKSVCINCIVMSLLYKVTPDEVKLVMIDPKKVEFSIYKNIPHLMAPVVTTPKDAAGALQASVEEMERRFELFEQVGVRDLKGYNTATANDPDMPMLPHIVIIIDELADLMMTARDEVETAICRIAQKARAAGMHLIIGTQRPSADVVTGLIKSNVPSRIAFTVKSQVDSRVILDHIGAESLTGRGDMLFVPIGSMRDMRVQGAFVDDKEVEKICEFIRATNGTAVYDEKFITKLKELAAQCGNKGRSGGDMAPAGGEDGGEKVADQKYADAVRIAIEEKRVSTSLLQRKLEIGYSRAAKLIDRMQSEGYVSPPDGSKPRTILITPEEYMEKFVDNPEGGAE